ncbi:MAG: hypothetical protein HRT58_22590 [Crocinitomicaceae bacterium]|nr:hypothetical protein [Flavobacteriales bacterium]NQZ38467.1 hypothetical protein [Crocinitomicaceae bacterium]
MKRKSTIAIALLSVLFFTACKKEASVNIDQNRIYSDYQVTYSQVSNQTVTQAVFRVDHNSGKKIELTYPARIGFNGENLAWRNLGGSYDATRSGNHLNGSFKYLDIDENSFENTGALINPIDLPFGMNNISKNGNFFLPWTGAALQSGETVKVVISGGSQSGSKTFNATAIGSSYISLDQYKLNNLVTGTAKIQILREKTAALQQSNLSGGRITSTYKGRKITVNITE